MGSHFLSQGVFLKQGSNPYPSHLLHWQVDSLPTAPPEKWVSPGGLVIETPHFQCSGYGFSPWSGNWDPAWTWWGQNDPIPIVISKFSFILTLDICSPEPPSIYILTAFVSPNRACGYLSADRQENHISGESLNKTLPFPSHLFHDFQSFWTFCYIGIREVIETIRRELPQFLEPQQ